MLPVGPQGFDNDSGHCPCFSCTLSGIHTVSSKLSLLSRVLGLAGKKSSSFRDYFCHFALSCFLLFLFCCWFVCLSSCLFVDYLCPDHQSGISHFGAHKYCRRDRMNPNVGWASLSPVEPIIKCHTKHYELVELVKKKNKALVTFERCSKMQINNHDLHKRCPQF